MELEEQLEGAFDRGNLVIQGPVGVEVGRLGSNKWLTSHQVACDVWQKDLHSMTRVSCLRKNSPALF